MGPQRRGPAAGITLKVRNGASGGRDEDRGHGSPAPPARSGIEDRQRLPAERRRKRLRHDTAFWTARKTVRRPASAAETGSGAVDR